MVSDVQIVAVVHAFFGVLWVGASFYIDVAWYRPWKNVRTVGELKVWQGILKPTGPFLGLSSILVIITGFIYMFMKYGTDFGVIWSLQPGRVILISLGLVIVALILAVTVINRSSVRLVRMPVSGEADTPTPGEARKLMDGIMRASAIGTAIIVVVLVLMVLTATGAF